MGILIKSEGESHRKLKEDALIPRKRLCGNSSPPFLDARTGTLGSERIGYIQSKITRGFPMDGGRAMGKKRSHPGRTREETGEGKTT